MASSRCEREGAWAILLEGREVCGVPFDEQPSPTQTLLKVSRVGVDAIVRTNLEEHAIARQRLIASTRPLIGWTLITGGTPRAGDAALHGGEVVERAVRLQRAQRHEGEALFADRPRARDAALRIWHHTRVGLIAASLPRIHGERSAAFGTGTARLRLLRRSKSVQHTDPIELQTSNVSCRVARRADADASGECIICSLMSVCGARCRLCWQCCQPHISSLVGSHCSGELIIIACEPGKQRRAAVDAGIDEENAC